MVAAVKYLQRFRHLLKLDVVIRNITQAYV